MATVWQYNGQDISLDQVPKELFGFTYMVTFTDGTKYIGKKQIWSYRNVKLGKKALAAREDKRSSKKELRIYESKWREYEGSSQHRGSRIVAKKEILDWCWTKTQLTYEETRQQFVHDVLFDDTFLNANILGKFFVARSSS